MVFNRCIASLREEWILPPAIFQLSDLLYSTLYLAAKSVTNLYAPALTSKSLLPCFTIKIIWPSKLAVLMMIIVRKLKRCSGYGYDIL